MRDIGRLGARGHALVEQPLLQRVAQPAQRRRLAVAVQHKRPRAATPAKAEHPIEAQFERRRRQRLSDGMRLLQQARRHAGVLAEVMQGQMQALDRQPRPTQAMRGAHALAQRKHALRGGRIRQHGEEQAFARGRCRETKRELRVCGRSVVGHRQAAAETAGDSATGGPPW